MQSSPICFVFVFCFIFCFFYCLKMIPQSSNIHEMPGRDDWEGSPAFVHGVRPWFQRIPQISVYCLNIIFTNHRTIGHNRQVRSSCDRQMVQMWLLQCTRLDGGLMHVLQIYRLNCEEQCKNCPRSRESAGEMVLDCLFFTTARRGIQLSSEVFNNSWKWQSTS